MTAPPPTPIDLSDPVELMGSFELFSRHPLVNSLRDRYKKDSVLADCARKQLVSDLARLNRDYSEEYGRVAFTTAEGRVKDEESFFMKLYKKCQERGPSHGIDRVTLGRLYSNIRDLCGVRFSCPYFDRVKISIDEIIRPALTKLNYVVDLGGKYRDKDYLDTGDDKGYRSYHFYVKIPTLVNIYGDWEYCLCEVQGRSELQHVWAVKSHDLLYKPGAGWEFSDYHVTEDMRQLSNHLRVADQFLISIRERVRKPGA